MVDQVGLLLYSAELPWKPCGVIELAKYRYSHNLADPPVWQGHLMAALGSKAAVLHRDGPSPEQSAPEHRHELEAVDRELERLASVYPYFYAVSGEPGLIGRSLLPGYAGEDPISWMVSGARSKWVRSETTGEWWRPNVSKDHLNMAVLGLGIPLALDRKGEIYLEERTRHLMAEEAMLPMVRRLVRDSYLIIDYDGKRTQHGDLRPDVLLLFANGFNRTLNLQMLASAAAYDPDLASEYEKRVKQWTRGIGLSMSLSGAWTRGRGHWKRKANVGWSDPQAYAMAACSFLLQEDRPKYAQSVKEGLAGWWRFMQYELNPIYTIVYAHFVVEDRTEQRRLMAGILEQLRDFPMAKLKPFPNDPFSKTVSTPGFLQPVAARPVDSNYWKANPYERVTAAARRNPDARYAGMDYLLAYWMGRYFGLIEPADRGE